jgi:hypothetical protein
MVSGQPAGHDGLQNITRRRAFVPPVPRARYFGTAVRPLSPPLDPLDDPALDPALDPPLLELPPPPEELLELLPESAV